MFEQENIKVILSATQEKNVHLQDYIKQIELGYDKLLDQHKKLQQKYDEKKQLIQELQTQIKSQEQKRNEMQKKINELSSHNCYDYLYPKSSKTPKTNFFTEFPINNLNSPNFKENTYDLLLNNSNHSQQQANNSNKVKPEKQFKINDVGLCDSYQDLNYQNDQAKNNSNKKIEHQQQPQQRNKKISQKEMQEYKGKSIVYLRYSYQGSQSLCQSTDSQQDDQSTNILNNTNNNNNININNQNGNFLHPDQPQKNILQPQQQNNQKQPPTVPIKNTQKYTINNNQNSNKQQYIDASPEQIIKPTYKKYYKRRTSNQLTSSRSHTRRSWRKFDFLLQQSNTPSNNQNNNNQNFLTTPLNYNDSAFFNTNSSSQGFFQHQHQLMQQQNQNQQLNNSISESIQSESQNSIEYQCMNDIVDRDQYILNSNIGDLLFEDFFIIGPNLQQLNQKCNTMKKSKQSQYINVEPSFFYRHSPQLNKHKEYLQLIKQRAFPFDVETEVFDVNISKNQDLPQKIKDIIYPKPKNLGFSPQDQKLGFTFDDKNQFYQQKSFVFNFTSPISYKNSYNINTVMLSSNPTNMLYCVCLQQEDFYLIRDDSYPLQNSKQKRYSISILDQQQQEFNPLSFTGKDVKYYKIQKYEKLDTQSLMPGQYKVARIPKVYCFLTYFPFVNFFIDIQKSIHDTLLFDNLRKLIQKSNTQIFNLDFSTQQTQIQKQSNIQSLLNKMQISVPEFSKLLYFRELDVYTNPINQWVPTVTNCNFLESEWGIGLVVSNFSFNDFWQILLCIIQERHILFFSDDLTLLTATIMTFQALLKPFSFQHVINFNLNIDLITYLESPVPYVIGVNKDLKSLKEILIQNQIETDTTVLIDLSSGYIYHNTFDPQQSSINQQIFQQKCPIPTLGQYNNLILQQYSLINPNIQSEALRVPSPQQPQQIPQNIKEKKKKKLLNKQETLQKQQEEEYKKQLILRKSKLLYQPNPKQQKILQEILSLLYESLSENIIKYIPENPIFTNEDSQRYPKSCNEIREHKASSKDEKKLPSAANLNNLNSNHINNTNDHRQKNNSQQPPNQKKVLDYKQINQTILKQVKQDHQFIQTFIKSQAFTYYLEQKYQISQSYEQDFQNKEDEEDEYFDLENDQNSFNNNDDQINRITEENELSQVNNM